MICNEETIFTVSVAEFEVTEPAALELFDAAGRQVARQAVGTLGPGDHMVTLGKTAQLRAGLYFLRLTQEGRVLHARVAVAR